MLECDQECVREVDAKRHQEEFCSLVTKRSRVMLTIDRDKGDELTRVGHVLPEVEAKVKELDYDLI